MGGPCSVAGAEDEDEDSVFVSLTWVTMMKVMNMMEGGVLGVAWGLGEV